MGAETGIEWARHTYNPWIGCTALSPACDFCYAAAWAERFNEGHLWKGSLRQTSLQTRNQPLKWDRQAAEAGMRHRVFCGSLMDFGDNQAEPEWRHDAWRVIERCRNLDWMLLTKRPQNYRKMLPGAAIGTSEWGEGWSNVWVGTTVEDRKRKNRIAHLRRVPARIRFLSIEPLLEDLGELDLTGIHLVIVGGESGKNARPMHPDWVRSIRDQCARAGVAFFLKQWGEWAPTGDWYENHPVSLPLRVWSKKGWTDDPCADGSYNEGEWLARIGKKLAGRELDGVEHDEMPAMELAP